VIQFPRVEARACTSLICYIYYFCTCNCSHIEHISAVGLDIVNLVSSFRVIVHLYVLLRLLSVRIVHLFCQY